MKILVRRKVKDGKNIEFEVKETETTPLRIKLGIESISKKTTIELVKNINDGASYYTKDNESNLCIVKVKGGTENVPNYLSSMSNDGKSDNIDSLPTYD